MDSFYLQRRAGVLLHPTSLPGSASSGKLNGEAFRFIDFLHDSGFTLWQILPLGPTDSTHSPYQSESCFALNSDLLDLSFVKGQHYFSDKFIDACLDGPNPIRKLAESFDTEANEQAKTNFEEFILLNKDWLLDYALYKVIKDKHDGRPWTKWPSSLRERDLSALNEIQHLEQQALNTVMIEQFLVYDAWRQIRLYASSKKVAIFGDLPIFVSHDSSDVWQHQSLFALDKEGNPLTVAGVPPDYFSETGQRWGNPHYIWDEMAKDDYSWWLRRIEHQLSLYDFVRIDHFRGLEAYWEIPAQEKTAIKGKWVKAHGKQLLEKLQEKLQKNIEPLPIIAEDLGIITPEVNALRESFNLPGMKILHFAFDSDADNPYLPHNHVPLSVVYTGTHDNNTTMGWYADLNVEIRERCLTYLGASENDMPWTLIKCALASVAFMAIVPMQDILALDGSNRMNTPGTSEGNWRWRFQWHDVPNELSDRLNALTNMYGRSCKDQSRN